MKPNPQNWGRVATLASVPLLVIVVSMASRAVQESEKQPLGAPAGVIAVANLRSEDLSLIELGPGGRAHTLSLPGAAHEMVFAGGRLYATFPRDSLLVEIDPGAPGILRERTLDGSPHGLALAGDNLLVTLDDANALVTMDRGNLEERARQATGQTPHTVAFGDGTAYVVAARDARLQAFGLAHGEAVTGAMPESVALVGAFVVTADHDAGTLSMFQREGLEPAGRIVLGGQPVRVVAYDSTHVAVSLSATGEVALVDLVAKKVTRRVRVGPYPDGICLDPASTFAAVATNGDRSVRVYALPGWSYIATLPAGDRPGACAWLPAR